MSETRRLTLAELRTIVTDPSELAKGTKVFDEGGLAHLARFGEKLFADAAGSGSAPYKVQIVFGEASARDPGIRGRCSCMAARSRPFCKHAAALLAAWARAPESFAAAAAPPAGVVTGEAKKKAVKTGKVDTNAAMAGGVAQVATLVRELAVAGVVALAADRVPQVRGLGAALRESRLRRLSARTLELGDHLERAAARTDSFDASAYAELLGDLLLTARKLEKHLAGEALADEHVEELIGKTWTKKDRRPVAGLELVEYGLLARTTSDGFVIRESRFLDLGSGEHYSEKQILPAFLAKRTEPKPSWAGKVLALSGGSLYPSFAPRRLDLEVPGDQRPLDQPALATLVERALPTASAALAALQERRKDVFAPDTLPVAVRADTLIAGGKRLQLVDGNNAALFLALEDDTAERLEAVLRGSRLVALLGDLALDGPLPSIFPLALVVERVAEGAAEAAVTLALEPLGQHDAAAILESKKIRAAALARERARPTRWVEVAHDLGAGRAAIALGEVREELAAALASGLATVVPRTTEAAASRLRELGLAKQADLLDAVATRPDPADKLDDFVKLHQVLGIALARLAATSTVDRDGLEPVESHPSVLVAAVGEGLDPREVARRSGAGTLDRYQAAVCYHRHFNSLPAATLLQEVYPTWANGAATPFIAAAATRAPEVALASAHRVLDLEIRGILRRWWGTNHPPARATQRTAIAVCAAIGSPAARDLLRSCKGLRDKALATHARRALNRLEGRAEVADRVVAGLSDQLRNAGHKDDRIKALRSIADEAVVELIPVVRASLAGDTSREVQHEAATTLARLGDVESVNLLLRHLHARAQDGDRAKVAARALGTLGDARAVETLLDCWVQGWQPGLLAEALAEVGPAVLAPLLDRIEADPTLAKRAAAQSVVASLPTPEQLEVVLRRLELLAAGGTASPTFTTRALLYLTVASEHKDGVKALRQRILELAPDRANPKIGNGAEKALAKKLASLA